MAGIEQSIPLQKQIDLAEAVIQLAMARHAEIPARGFDSRRKREQLHQQIDEMLDHLNWLRIQAAIEHNTPL